MRRPQTLPRGMGLPQEAPQGARAHQGRRRLPHEGQLSPDLQRRTDRGRVSRGGVVSKLRPAGSRTDHHRAPDRRAHRGGVPHHPAAARCARPSARQTDGARARRARKARREGDVVSASDGGKTQMKARAEAAALLPQTKVTLVAWYGPKEALLASLIAELEALVAKELGKLFEPYAPEQVHATVIGLETVVHHERRVGANFLLARDVDAEIDPERALEIIQTSEHLPFALRIGGQRPDEPAEFLSRDQHPFLRSACVRGGAVVAMGWPWKDARWTSSLEGI